MSPVQFTTLIRLPFARADFEDPPQVRTVAACAADLLIHKPGTMGCGQGSPAMESHFKVFKDK